MEGRNPPPRANHPFPNNPNVYKFWGAPFGRTYFRSLVVLTALYGSLAYLNTFGKDEPNMFGYKSLTPEEFKRRVQLIDQAAPFKQLNLPIEMDHQHGTGDLRFDEGIKFSPLPEELTVIR